MSIRDELLDVAARGKFASYATDSPIRQGAMREMAAPYVDAILKAFGIVPLAGVERFEGNSGGVSFGTAKGEGYPVYVRGAVVHSYVGYWNLAQGDDPTPAIAAQILAMREAQEAVES